jgi:hypothetical protein
VSIYVFAVAICESSVGSLYLEPEFLVEGYGGRIVRVYAEVQPRKIQPVVCEVEASLHQRGADAPSLPTIPYSYAKVSRVSSPRVHVDTQCEVADDLTLYASHYCEVIVPLSGQFLAPSLLRGVRNPECFGHCLQGGVDEVHGFVIFRFAAPDDQVTQADSIPFARVSRFPLFSHAKPKC